MNLRDKILTSQDLDREPFAAPKWGLPEGLYVRGLTAAEHVQLTSDKVQRERSYSARMAAMALVDDQGNRLFADNEWQELQKKDMATIEAIGEVCMRLSGMGAKEEAELKKTSEPIETNGSPADSLYLSGEPIAT